MYMSQPSRFRRSSEREDPDGARPEEARRAEAEEQLRLQRFEEIGFSAGAASVLVEPIRRSSVADKRYDDFGEVVW